MDSRNQSTFTLKPNLIAIYETNYTKTWLSKAWDQIFAKIITSPDEEQNTQWITDVNLMDGIHIALHSKLDYKFCLLYIFWPQIFAERK